MGTIADKLQYLLASKEAIKQAIQGKGVSVSDSNTFRDYAALIGSIDTSGGDYGGGSSGGSSGGGGGVATEPKLEKVTIIPTAEGVVKTPSAGYDGFSEVNVVGDANLIAANIKKGVTLFGIEGAMEMGFNAGALGTPVGSSGVVIYTLAQVEDIKYSDKPRYKAVLPSKGVTFANGFTLIGYGGKWRVLSPHATGHTDTRNSVDLGFTGPDDSLGFVLVDKDSYVNAYTASIDENGDAKVFEYTSVTGYKISGKDNGSSIAFTPSDLV